LPHLFAAVIQAIATGYETRNQKIKPNFQALHLLS
jgi:hypothetical protein